MVNLLNIKLIIFVEFASSIQFNICFYFYHPNLSIKSNPNLDFNYEAISISCYFKSLVLKIVIISNNWPIIWHSIGMPNLILLSELSPLLHLSFLLRILLPPNHFLRCTCHNLNLIKFMIIFAFSRLIFWFKDLILCRPHYKFFKI